jgi:hypothetical protein
VELAGILRLRSFSAALRKEQSSLRMTNQKAILAPDDNPAMAVLS